MDPTGSHSTVGSCPSHIRRCPSGITLSLSACFQVKFCFLWPVKVGLGLIESNNRTPVSFAPSPDMCMSGRSFKLSCTLSRSWKQERAKHPLQMQCLFCSTHLFRILISASQFLPPPFYSIHTLLIVFIFFISCFSIHSHLLFHLSFHFLCFSLLISCWPL